MIRPRDRRHMLWTRRSFQGRVQNDDIHARTAFGRFSQRVRFWDLMEKKKHRAFESIAKAARLPRRRRRSS